MSSLLHDQHLLLNASTLSQAVSTVVDTEDALHHSTPANVVGGVQAEIPLALTTILQELAQQLTCSLPELVLAAFTLFLSRYTGQEIVHLGVMAIPSENAIAPATLPTIDLDFSEPIAIVTLLEQLQSGEPHMLQTASMQTVAAPTLTYSYRSYEHAANTAHYRRHLDGELAIQLTDPISGTQSDWMYHLGRLDATIVAKLPEHFQIMLASLAEQPSATMDHFELLTSTQQHQILVAWNDTTVTFPDTACIHALFEQQVRQTPDAPALTFEQTTLTYRQLDRRANQLAHYLQKVGVGPEALIGICADRSIELVIGVLGVLKAGGAYVPLDPSYPTERLRFMIADAQMPVILCQGSYDLKRQLAGLEQDKAETMPMLVRLDSDWAQIAKEPETTPLSDICAENLAYVIYTSGSTGKPKGVLLQHRGLVNLVLGQIEAFAITAQSRLLQFASFSFDASVSEIFITLVAGAHLFLARRETLISPEELHAVLRTNAISCVTLPPSLLTLLPTAGLTALETVISAGESCSWEIAQRWMVGRQFFNAYGPTEATVGPTVFLAEQVVAGTHTVPIGRPLPNVQLFVLDRFGAPAPIGIPGELYIGGVGLSRGYLNRPELTDQRFSYWEHASLAEPIRLYRTGDLVRYLPDSNLEFLGRIDHQVKLRGLRIELGEIEATLREHPSVQEAIVITHDAALGDTRLVAYATTSEQKLELWPSVAEYFVYDELLYHAMTNDERRNQSYLLALKQAVQGKVALDIGTGRDAILARLAIEAGARKVYAIELLEESYHHAKATIERLGLSGRITLIHGDVRTVTLPEPIDVCVSEIVGAIGGSEGASMLINDAWRFMKPDGIMIPARSKTQIAAISLPDDLRDNPRFTPVSAHYVEEIFAQRGYKFDLRLCLRHTSYRDLLSTLGTFEDLDFTAPTNAEYERHEKLIITNDGRIDGFLVWLNLITAPGEVIDILAHEHCWLPVYLPVFATGVEVSAGDQIELEVISRLCENGLNPDYLVRGTLFRQAGKAVPFEYWSYHYKPDYRRSPFYACLFAHDAIPVQPHANTSSDELREHLRSRLPHYMVPAALVVLDAFPLTPNGKVDRRALPAPEFQRAAPVVATEAPTTAEEITIASIWSRVLGLPQIGLHDDFFALGGHSLLAARALSQTSAALKRTISLRTLFEYPTVASFAHAIQDISRMQSAITPQDLAAKLVLDPTLTPAIGNLEFANEARAVLLTGVTGFLGAFLLQQLLRQTDAHIYCLVRAKNQVAAHARIEQTMREFQLWNEEWRTRLVAVVGDLRLPQLGLSTPLFRQLAASVDSIYHAGAQVHYLSSFAALEQANVQGTVEIIRLAAEGCRKRIHFISSIAVALSSDPTNTHTETNLPICTSASGYVQSKWVAEGILRLAQMRGFPITIYRPGRMSGDSETGVINSDDFFLRLLAGCIQLGLAPDLPMVENLMPVDYVAQSIVQLSSQAADQQTFHILNQHLVDWKWVVAQAQAYGYSMRVAPYQEWYQALMQIVPFQADHALHSLRFLIPPDPVNAEWMLAWSDHMGMLHNTQLGSTLDCPPIDTFLLHRMLDAGIRSGLFPPLRREEHSKNQSFSLIAA